MAFDFNQNPLRIYGIWPQTPFPLEVSIYGYCQMSCSFCFANRNRDAAERNLHLQNSAPAFFRQVNRLVAIAFLPNPNGFPEVNHLDGDKTNNIVTNLEWVTRSQNELHAFATGLKQAICGERIGTSKLTTNEVLEIRAGATAGKTQASLAHKHSVSQSAISRIVSREIWSHI